MEHPRLRSRDFALVGVNLAMIVFLSLGYLAGELGDRSVGSPLLVEPPTRSALLKGILLLAGGVAITARLGRALVAGVDKDGSRNGGLHDPVAAVSLTSFAVGQIVVRFVPGLGEADIAAIVVLSTAALVLVVFFGQGGPRLRESILVGIYALACVSIYGTTARLVEVTDFARAAAHTKVLTLALSAAGLLILALPLSLQVTVIREGSKPLLLKLKRMPQSVFGAMTLGSVAAIWVPSLMLNDGEQTSILARLGWLALLVIGLALLLIHEREIRKLIPTDEGARVRPPGWVGGVLLLTLGGYLVVSWILARNWHDSLNPDGLAYLAIAKQFASGRFAVRGYWSPLISWLMAPLIAGGIGDVAALRVATISAGALWIVASYLAGLQLRMSAPSLAFLTLTFGALAARTSVVLTTPDLLGSALIIFYFGAVVRLHPATSAVRRGILIGGLTAAAYLGKYYNLPFIAAHMILVVGLMLGGNKRWRARLALSSAVTATVLVLPWAIALSSRYGEITFTTSGAISRALVGPGANLLHPCWSVSLSSLPGDVLFPCEDPHPSSYPLYGWSPLSSLENLRHQIALTFSNAYWWFGRTWLQLGPIIPISTLTSGVFALISWRDPKLRSRWLLLFLTPLLYASGYFLTWSADSRYYYPVFTIAILASFYILDMLVKLVWSMTRGRGTCLIAISASLLSLPLVHFMDTDYFAVLLEGDPPACLTQPLVLDLSILHPPMAGLDESVNYLAYRTDVRTYGVVTRSESLDELDRSLRWHGVSTLIIPDEDPLWNTLEMEMTYAHQGEFSFCGRDFVVLGVPGVVPAD